MPTLSGSGPGPARWTLLAAALSSAFLLAAPPAGVDPVPASERTVDLNPFSLLFDAAGNGLSTWRGPRTADADQVLP